MTSTFTPGALGDQRARRRIPLTRALLRNRNGRGPALLAAAGALLSAMYFLGLTAVVPSPEQTARARLGPYDRGITVAWSHGDPTPGLTVPSRLRQAGARSAAAWIDYAFAFRRLGDANGRVLVQEGPWGSPDAPGDIVLLDGRWPSAPGEALASADLRDSSYADFGSRISLRIVGHYADRTQTYRGFLLAVGTGASWPWNELDDAGMTPFLTVAWSGVSTNQVDPALEPLTPYRSQGRITERQELLRAPVAAKEVIAIWIPALLVSLATGGLLGLLVRRRAMRAERVLTAIGLSGRSVAAQTLAYAAIMALAGGGVGLALGFILRGAVSPLLTAAHRGRAPSMSPLWWLYGALALVVLTLGTACGHTLGRIRVWRSRAGTARGGSRAEWTAPIITAMVGVAVLATLTRFHREEMLHSQSRLLFLLLSALGAALLAPLVHHGLRYIGSHGSPARMLAERVGSRSVLTTTATLVLVTMLSATVLGFGAFKNAGLAQTRAGETAGVLPGQLALVASRFSRDAGSVQSQLSTQTGLGEPIELGVSGWYAPGIGPITTLASVAALEAIAGSPVEPSVRTAFASGTLVTISAQAMPDRVDVAHVGRGATERRVLALVAIPSDQHARIQRGAFLLAGILPPYVDPQSPPRQMRSTLLWTGVTDAQQQQALAELDAAAITPDALLTPLPPGRSTLPLSDVLQLSLLGVAAGLSTGVTLIGTAKAVRPYAAAMHALGLPRGWSTSVLAWTTGRLAVTIVGCGLLGMAIGMVGLSHWLGPVPTWPWTLILLFVLAVIGTAALTTVSSSYLVSPRERYDQS